MPSKLVEGKDGYWRFSDTTADFTYSPKVKQLVDVVHIPQDLKLLDTILANYEYKGVGQTV